MLERQNSDLSKRLAQNIKDEYSKRRTDITDVICFLNQMRKRIPASQKLNFYKEPSTDKITEFISKFKIQIDTDQFETKRFSNSNNVDDIISLVENAPISQQNLSESVNEYEKFVQFGILGPSLSKLKDVIELIKPTSTDCERIF